MRWSISTWGKYFGAPMHIACVAWHTDEGSALSYKQCMCFSATASFSAGTVLLVIGAACLVRSQGPKEWPYALIPAFFGVQQLLEGGLWLSLGPQNSCWTAPLTQGYSVFSQVFWPIYIPLAVYLLEPVGMRRRFIGLIAAGGAAVGCYLAWYMAHIPVVAEVRGAHVAYVFPHFHQPLATVLYVLAACLAPLLSGWAQVRWFGVLASVSLAATAYFYAQWFISTWCFFAACLSALIWFFFAQRTRGASTA